MGYDHDNERELALGELSADRLAVSHPLLAPHGEETVAGLLRTEAGVFLVASRPILTGEGKGPSRGRVVIGRLLNQAAIERFGTQTQVQLQVELLPEVQGAKLPAEEKTAALVRHTPVQLRVDGTTTRGTVEVADLGGAPLLRFRVDTERAIVAQGQATLRYAALSLTAAGALVLLTLLVFLRQTVFSPIATLTRHARTIGSRGDLNARLAMHRTDEIGTLAREFDIMVERLAATRQQLVEQSYQSGIAEMARGALHNIGNAITPIGVKLINLRRELKQAPLARWPWPGRTGRPGHPGRAPRRPRPLCRAGRRRTGRAGRADHGRTGDHPRPGGPRADDPRRPAPLRHRPANHRTPGPAPADHRER